MSIYHDQIIELYKNPLNQGYLKKPSTTHQAYSPLCGDDITVELKIENNIITDIMHHGVGCAISQAAVSLVSEEVKGKSLAEVLKINQKQVTKILGVKLSPSRLKCALLGLEAIHQAIQKYEQNIHQ